MIICPNDERGLFPAQDQFRQPAGGLPPVAGRPPQAGPPYCLLKAGVVAILLVRGFPPGDGLIDVPYLPVDLRGYLQPVILRPLDIVPPAALVEMIDGTGAPHVDKKVVPHRGILPRRFLRRNTVQQQRGQLGAHQRLGDHEIQLFLTIPELHEAHPVLPRLAGAGEEGVFLHHMIERRRLPHPVLF